MYSAVDDGLKYYCGQISLFFALQKGSILIPYISNPQEKCDCLLFSSNPEVLTQRLLQGLRKSHAACRNVYLPIPCSQVTKLQLSRRIMCLRLPYLFVVPVHILPRVASRLRDSVRNELQCRKRLIRR